MEVLRVRKGGDIFTFVMERDNLPFGEALTLLAAKAGVVLDERSRAEDVRRARLREVLEGAVSFYHAILTTHDLGKPALDYLHARGFTDATIESQRLGWAPESWDACSKALAAKRGATPKSWRRSASPPIVAAVAGRMIVSALASSSPSATRAARSPDSVVAYSPLTTRAAIMDRSI